MRRRNIFPSWIKEDEMPNIKAPKWDIQCFSFLLFINSSQPNYFFLVYVTKLWFIGWFLATFPLTLLTNFFHVKTKCHFTSVFLARHDLLYQDSLLSSGTGTLPCNFLHWEKECKRFSCDSPILLKKNLFSGFPKVLFILNLLSFCQWFY